MSGYIGKGKSVVNVESYTKDQADAEFVNDPNSVISVSGSNVGIGTSSPESTLEVRAGSNASLSNGVGHVIVGPDSRTSLSGDYSGGILFSQANGSQGGNKGASITGYQDGGDVNSTGITFNVHDGNGAANRFEAMRIDSSGNLLVGTTSSFGSSGITLGSNSVIYAAASSQNVANFQRYTTDGEIVRFGKDGTTVGSIGSIGGDIFVGTGDTTLRFYDAGNAITPRGTDGAANNGVIDLGGSSERFKDGHFGGTVTAGSFSGDGSALTGVGGSTTFGAVGTYIWGRPANLTDYAAGATASSLYATSSKNADTPPYYTSYVSGGWDSAITVATSVSGTWRCMAGTGKYDSNYAPSSLWVRIS